MSCILTIILPELEDIIVNSLPGIKPREPRWRFVSLEPPIFCIYIFLPCGAIDNGITKPSVSVAMKNLKQKGLISVEEKGYIELTEEGYNIANMVYERHVVISKMLEKLGVSPDIAVKDACKIEHVISAESFQAIKEHVKKYI